MCVWDTESIRERDITAPHIFSTPFSLSVISFILSCAKELFTQGEGSPVICALIAAESHTRARTRTHTHTCEEEKTCLCLCMVCEHMSHECKKFIWLYYFLALNLAVNSGAKSGAKHQIIQIYCLYYTITCESCIIIN